MIQECKSCLEENKVESVESYQYLPVLEALRSEALGDYVSYGIRVTREGKEINFVSDVTTDREAIEYLCAICTEKGLSVDHLMDVIEDFLEEGSFQVTENS